MNVMEDLMSDQAIDHTELARVVAVINGKGGVLKTSITANVAGRLATAGYHVLAIDLDISGNLKLDLGLIKHPQEDGGKGLVEAIWSNGEMPIVRDVRKGLDVIFGGRELAILESLNSSSHAGELPGGSVPGEFARKLAEVAPDYDLILLDCPPGNAELQDMALAATRWVLIPTKTDQGSWDGLLAVGPRVKKARQTNRGLGYLGVVITDHNPAATRVLGNTKARLDEVGETVPLLDTWIRHTQAAAHDCRSRGQLAHELARDATASNSQRFAALSARRAGDNVIPLPTALSGTADSLAGDYTALAKEITDKITAAEAADQLTAESNA
jgi:cellulose biosynthesis protein BcsQ